MDDAALHRSIVHAGSQHLSVKLFDKLAAGRPIVLGVVGASVAQNAGCLDQPGRRCMNYDGVKPVAMSWGQPRNRPFKGFAVRFLEHINASFPHVSHRINNSGVDKTPLSSMLKCLWTRLPEQMDIVLIDFNSMARWTKSDAIEGVIRQLAAMPEPPVQVVVSVHSWCLANFVKKVEDESDRVCEHYGVTCLSQKRALLPVVKAGNLTKEQLVGRDCIHPINGPLGVDTMSAMLNFWFDRESARVTRAPRGRHHWPSAAAARGQQQRRPLVDSLPAGLPAPLWSTNADALTRSRGQRCLTFSWPDAGERGQLGASTKLIPWRTTSCAHEGPWVHDDLRWGSGDGGTRLSAWTLTQRVAGAATSAKRCRAPPFAQTITTNDATDPESTKCPDAIVRAGGAAYEAFLSRPPRGFFSCDYELKPPSAGANRFSFGVVALTPGATLHFVSEVKPPFAASLTYLTSYAGMGIAAVRCVGGACACDEQVVDAHVRDDSNASVFAELALNVTATNGSDWLGRGPEDEMPSGMRPPAHEAPCCVQIQLLRRTSSGGHKFKVRYVLLQPARFALRMR